MPTNNLPTIWPANPHTLAKIAILKAYLNAYFPIFGRSKRGQDILLVDGFAGPGEYTNAPEGSPIAALKTAIASINGSGSAWIAGDVTCVFIEPDHKRCQNLQARVAQIEPHPKVKTSVLESTFVDGIADLRLSTPQPFTTEQPLFVFIDPFGATGVPFDVVKAILGTPCSEVLINLDSDGIARNVSAPPSEVRDRILTSIFGDESWREALLSVDFKILCQQVLRLYKDKLREIKKVEYIFSFEMRGSADLLNYHLVFASQNPLGLEKMKEAMRSIDKSGSYRFSDGHINQTTMFRFDHPEDFAPNLHREFVGQEVSYAMVNKFTLNETPFINPIKMLTFLHGLNQIEVSRIDPSTKGFSAAHIRAVRFLNVAPCQREATKGTPPTEQKGLFDGD